MVDVGQPMRAGVAVLIEFLFFGTVFSVAVAVLARSVAAGRRQNASSRRASGGARAGATTGDGPVAAAFPIERNEHERRVGDAAFVDGLIVGRYFVPHRPEEAEDCLAAGGVEDREAGGAREADSAGDEDGPMPGPGVGHVRGTAPGGHDMYAAPSPAFDALGPELGSEDEHTAGWGGVDESLEDDEFADPFGDPLDDAFDDGFDDGGDW